MKEQRKTFADVCASFIGKPYSPHGVGPESYSCLGFVVAFMRANGKRLEDALCYHEGYGPGNFHEAWVKDKQALEKILIEGAEKVGTGIKESKKLAGDLLILRSKNGNIFPGVYVGNGNFMASYSDGGVRVFNLGPVEVVAVRRLDNA